METMQQAVTPFEAQVRADYSRHPGLDRGICRDVSARCDRTVPIEFLAARFPVVRRLAGGMSFRIVARRFLTSEPPDTPIPPSYGDNFPRFLRTLGSAASIEYVADVAELEMARGTAERAPHAPAPVKPASSAPQIEQGMRVRLHPSMYLLQSRFPIVTIWEANQSNDAGAMIDRWGAEAAVVARPFLEVEVRRLPPGGYQFLRALSEGQTVAAAAAIAGAATPRFALGPNLALLWNINLAVGIQKIN